MKQIVESIFIVDDDADDRQIIQNAFLEAGASTDVTLFESGQALMKQLSEFPQNVLPSLILLDLNMPGKDGREVLAEIKSKITLRHIPIVIFTTSSFDKDRHRCYELGANCFVTKPSAYDQILATIQSISKLWLSDMRVKSTS